MEEALVARLVGVTAIAAHVGSQVSWGGFQRGDGSKAIALFKISPGREWTHGGPDNLDRPRVQFDCRGANATEALSIARLVQAEMEGGADVSGIRFHPAMIEGDGFVDEGETEGGVAFFRVSHDYLFYFEEID